MQFFPLEMRRTVRSLRHPHNQQACRVVSQLFSMLNLTPIFSVSFSTSLSSNDCHIKSEILLETITKISHFLFG
jgi:hypothetical protein